MMTSNIEPKLHPLTVRHDGWTGEAMAKFLETLAETGIVLEACDAASKSSTAAYAQRRRHPLFAQAWETALGLARDRLADTLLGRSLEGNVEQIIKDGEIVAEKHYLDNRLGLAILKRLDLRTNATPLPMPSPTSSEPDWDLALTALRTGEADDIAKALAMLKGPEVGEVCDPLIDEPDGANFDHPRIWQDMQTGEWRTDYPAPPGFDGDEAGQWEDGDYSRSLCGEELAALVAGGIVEIPAMISIEEDEAERDAFFASLMAGHANCPPKNELGGGEFGVG